jgi:sigma-B regulation protein RsbU (phosphoserine phosphatase)
LSEQSDRSAGDAPAAALIDDLEDLFENAPCGYLSADKDGRIGRANRTFANWIGLTSDSLKGRRFSDLLPIAGKIYYETHFAPLLHMQGHFNEVALDIVCADGSKLPVLINAVERRDQAGQPSFIRLTIFNATDRRRYERSLLKARDAAEAEVMSERATAELREQFIAVLGHDLRNPLASIASGVRLLEKEAISERGKRVLGLMDGSVVRAAGLIDNVLDFARGRLGGGLTLSRDADEPLEPVLRQVVSELRSLDPKRTVTAHYAIDEPVDCDRVRIGQLLSNLLGNALTHGAKSLPVRVSASTIGGRLEISVANGGAPISAKAMERLFHPFVRGEVRPNRDGLGLGLHIASEIAKAHGGELTVTSDAVETRFTFLMPLDEKAFGTP